MYMYSGDDPVNHIFDPETLTVGGTTSEWWVPHRFHDVQDL